MANPEHLFYRFWAGEMTPHFSAASASASIAVIGAGRLGRVLARALRHAGLAVDGPLGRGDEVAPVDIAILCVPDAAIADAARALDGRANLVGHVSGATSLSEVDFSLHPLQTFTGDETPDVFRGIGCAIDGRTDAALAAAAGLVEALGARAFRIDDERRATYHAAASLASNLVLTVLDAADQLAQAAGMQPDEARSLLAPLARRTAENWQSVGGRAALTGPIVRGDELTVSRQRAAIAATRPELVELFDQLCASTRVLAGREVDLREADVREMDAREADAREADAA